MRRLIPFALGSLVLIGCPEGNSSAPPVAPPVVPPPVPAEATTPPEPEPASSLGWLSEGGVRLDVVSLVAVWNAEDSELNLVALPFEPTPDELKRIQHDELFFMVTDRDDMLPGFPDRMPFAEIGISWPFDKDDVGNPDTSQVHVFMCNVKEKGSNMNVTRGQGEGLTFAGDLEPGAEVQIHVQNEVDFMGKALAWDLTFEGNLLEALPKD